MVNREGVPILKVNTVVIWYFANFRLEYGKEFKCPGI